MCNVYSAMFVVLTFSHRFFLLFFRAYFPLQTTLFSAGYDGKMLHWDTSKLECPIATCTATAPISSACQMTPSVFAAACIDGSYANPPPSLPSPPPPPLSPAFVHLKRSCSLHDIRTQSPVSNLGKRPKGRPMRVVRLTSSTFALAGSGKKCVPRATATAARFFELVHFCG